LGKNLIKDPAYILDTIGFRAWCRNYKKLSFFRNALFVRTHNSEPEGRYQLPQFKLEPKDVEKIEWIQHELKNSCSY
jgi:hypothetical protein